MTQNVNEDDRMIAKQTACYLSPSINTWIIKHPDICSGASKIYFSSLKKYLDAVY